MPILTIDTAATRANYAMINDRVDPACTVAGVVKADAYGLGVEPIAKALYKEGCRLFFTATLPEALAVRKILGGAPKIALLGGLPPNHHNDLIQNNIIPVLNYPVDLDRYKAVAKIHNKLLPAIIHIDTGMNRLGFDAKEIENIANDPTLFDGLDILYIMSHFASADELGALQNHNQYDLFKKLASLFPNIPGSLCNSFGLFQNNDWHLDMVRPGMALYGLNPTPYKENPMLPVVKLEIEILQIREAHKNETCGYNATYCFDKKTKLAIVNAGYADGIFRTLSNNANMYWNGIPCPIRGRVSMDLTIVDLCNIPENQMPMPGDMLEIIGPHQTADDLAKAAGTIGYEILTSLGNRYERIYIDENAD